MEKVVARVLVIDDDFDAAFVTSQLFSLYGFKTRIALSGEDGVAQATFFLPNVVVVDIGMPELDGHEVANRLRKLPGCRNATLIAYTGYSLAHVEPRALSSGFDKVLQKPASIEELLQAAGGSRLATTLSWPPA